MNNKYVFRVIRLITLIILGGFLQLSAASYSQTITLKEKNIPIQEVFNAINQQTGYEVAGFETVLERAAKVTVSVKDMPLADFLDMVLPAHSLTYTISEKTILIKKAVKKVDVLDGGVGTSLTAQQRKVSGKVTDGQGEPLEGVTVKIKGSGTISNTDAAGVYEVLVPDENAILVFSIVGFETQEQPVAMKQRVDVTLKIELAGLEEVVVVGYGTQKRINLTGSVASISGDEITKTPTNNITNAIGGRMAGVVTVNSNGRPGSGSTVQVRGSSTLNDNSALVVIDGIVRSDGFGNLDPNEIDQISVLKDASAAAVYGARAANGVILITTKRGKLGKPQINYSGMVGQQTPTQYPEVMDAYAYGLIKNAALLNQGYDPQNPSQAGRFYTDGQLEGFKPGVTNWYDETFRERSLQSQHNLSINGGTEAIRYFTSIGYLDQDGMYDNLNFKRYNLRANIDAKINDNLTVGLNVEGRQELAQAPGQDANYIFQLVLRALPTIPAYYPDGLPYNTNGEHPAEIATKSGYNRTKQNFYQGAINFDQKLPFITEGLSVKGSYSYFTQSLFGKAFITPYNMYDEDADGNITGVKVVGTRTSLTEQFVELSNQAANISLNYARTFGKHDVSGLLLYEQYSSRGDSLSATKAEFATDIKDEFFASGPLNQTIDGKGLLKDSRRSVVGRLNYVLDSKYLLEATFRYDGSYRFPENSRFGFFPAVSAGWIISEESFFKQAAGLSFVDRLKIRASRGVIGNDRVNAFQYLDTYNIVSNAGPVMDGSPAAYVAYGVYPNPSITWEKQDNTNIGLDASFLRSMFSVELDYFFRTTTDILWSRERSVPGTFGRNLPDENYAEVKSSGVDLSIGYKHNINKLSYNVRLVGSYATNKVTQIDDPSNALDFEKQLGRPIGFQAGYQAMGLFNSAEEAGSWANGYQFGQESLPGDIKYADLNGDGEITIQDQKVISPYSSVPRIMYGVSADLNWKNFDLSFMFQGAVKRNMMLAENGRVLFINGGSNNNFSYLADSWSPDNLDASYPLAWVDSRTINNRNSNFWLRDAGYIRLKSVDLGYTFDSNWLKNNHISRLRVYLSGYNLFTVSEVKEFDPEAETGTGKYYPQQRTINLGLNLTF